MKRTYSLEELAVALKRTTKELQKLAEKGILTGRKVQGKWTFAAPDVVDWLEHEMTKGEMERAENLPEIANDAESSRDQPLGSFFKPGLIDVNFSAKTKASVFVELTNMATNAGYLWDPDAMATELRKREEMASTALEYGVAILHPRRPRPELIAEDFLALGIAGRGVPFGDADLTRYFFLLCCGDDSTYLKTLSKLAKLVRTPEFLDELQECDSEKTVLELFVRYD